MFLAYSFRLQCVVCGVTKKPFYVQPKWTLKDGGRSPPRGGFNATAENQQILPPDELELQIAAQAGKHARASVLHFTEFFF
jgi:hypothetical protein